MRGDDRITSKRVLRTCFQLEILWRRCSIRSSSKNCTGSLIWISTGRAKAEFGHLGPHWGKLVRFKASTIAPSRIHGPPAGSISGAGDTRRERPTGCQPESVHRDGGDQCGGVSGGMVFAE